MLTESLEHNSFFRELEFYLIFGQTRNVDQLASKDYIEQWLRKPGVRALFVPPRTLTTAWKNTFSLERFPVSKFVKVLPPVPAPQKRLSKIKLQSTSTENETARSVQISANNDLSTPSPDDPRYTLEVSLLKPLATDISFQQVGTPTSISFQESANNFPTDITFQQSADNFPTGRTFQQVDALPESNGAKSERVEGFVISQAPDQESKSAQPSGRTVSAQITFSEPVSPEEKQIDEKHHEGVDEPTAPLDKAPSPEIDGVGNDSPSSNVTGGVFKQVV
jgi:hypothetical protein